MENSSYLDDLLEDETFTEQFHTALLSEIQKAGILKTQD